MSFKQATLKFAELVRLTGKIINQAFDAAGFPVVSGNDIERCQPYFLGEIPLLQGLCFKIRKVDWPQQGFIDDDTIFVNKLRKQ